MPLRPRPRGCPFLGLLSFGQAKESNWPPWMATKPHTDVSRFSRKRRSAEPTCPHPILSRKRERGNDQTATLFPSPQQTTAILNPQAPGGETANGRTSGRHHRAAQCSPIG